MQKFPVVVAGVVGVAAVVAVDDATVVEEFVVGCDGGAAG